MNITKNLKIGLITTTLVTFPLSFSSTPITQPISQSVTIAKTPFLDYEKDYSNSYKSIYNPKAELLSAIGENRDFTSYERKIYSKILYKDAKSTGLKVW